MERLAVNVLAAFTLCVSAVTLVLLARPLVGYRTRVTNVWWIWGTRVPSYSQTYLEARTLGWFAPSTRGWLIHHCVLL
jgi:hypothetical protein